MSKAEKLCPFDIPLHREIWCNRYDRGERETSLTIDDIERIDAFLTAVRNSKNGAFTFTRMTEEQYNEVLSRFNKHKQSQQ